ncbi:hypothetical protein CLHUN_32350 [Ruminiclostridium hungatei]|uniref:Uncharacterized protein n=1 Tax=Ruminiclostridium hungatei TaxID=48256 RepID=A0A1V4SI42_RUMHU|nr:hypothetical protein CLHUN_32350 [Ruminiclostridium hungatei]
MKLDIVRQEVYNKGNILHMVFFYYNDFKIKLETLC